MPKMIATQSMFYDGTRKSGERFDVPSAALALAFSALGQAKFADDEGDTQHFLMEGSTAPCFVTMESPAKAKRKYRTREMRADK